MTTLQQKLNSLPMALRKKIASRIDVLVAEEMTMRAMRKTRKVKLASRGEERGDLV